MKVYITKEGSRGVLKEEKTKIAIICIVTILFVAIIALIVILINSGELVKTTAVRFTKTGQYTTSVSSGRVDISKINKDNIEISYLAPKAIASETTDESPEELFETVKVNIESVNKNENGGFDISFIDEKAKEYTTPSYLIDFKDLNDVSATIPVDFPEIKLTPDIGFVTTGATTTKVTLAIDGSEFEEGITKDDIKLDNSFSNMTIESVSNSDKNLTMQLSGSPVRSIANSYDFGSIEVSPTAIKDGYADVRARFDIEYDNAYFDSSSLKFADGKITTNLMIYGVADINTLTKDNVSVEGARVESVEKKDNNTLSLTLTADGINNVNDFVDLVGGKTLKLSDYETKIELMQADFYPVFDYVEKKGDNLRLSVKLYAIGGTFDSGLKSDSIWFAGDFDGAKIESVKIDNDTVATLIFSIPANGKTAETMKLDGTITLAQGALVNKYGEKTSKERSYTRDYSGQSLGRDVELNIDTLLEIQKYTRGKDTVLGSIFYWGGIAGKTYSFGKSILEVIGVVESEHSEIMRTLNEINQKLDQVLEGIKEIRKDILDLSYDVQQTKLINYNSDIITIRKKTENLNDVYAQAKKELAAKDQKYANIDWDKLSEGDSVEYTHALYEHIMAKVNEKDVSYIDFESDAKALKDAFERVAGALEVGDQNNPILIYDQACSKRYNFDSQAYLFRLSQRVAVESLLTRAKATLALRYDAAKNPEGAAFKGVNRNYIDAMNKLGSKEIDDIGHPARDVKTGPYEREKELYPYSYVFGKKVNIQASGLFDDPYAILGVPIDLPSARTLPNEKRFYSYEGALRKCTPELNRYMGRNWTDGEIEGFMARLHGNSIRNDLESAGLEILTPLLTKLNSPNRKKYKNYMYNEYIGDIIDNENNQVSKDAKLQTVSDKEPVYIKDQVEHIVNHRFVEAARFDLWD